MTNFEKYKNEILEFASEGQNVAVTRDNEIKKCIHTNCSDCIFRAHNCIESRIKWLYKEARRWTYDEIALAKLLKKFGATEVYADCNGPHWKDNDGYHGELPIDAFGELRAGKRVSLDDIIAEKE